MDGGGRDGRFVTGGSTRAAGLVTPALDGAARSGSAAGLPDLPVPVPDAASTGLIRVKVWSSEMDAPSPLRGGPWLSKVAEMDSPAGLPGRSDEAQGRPRYSQDGDVVSFADGYPLLLVSEESLAQVNEWIADGAHAAEGPLPMTRFRPNVVVAGAAASLRTAGSS